MGKPLMGCIENPAHGQGAIWHQNRCSGEMNDPLRLPVEIPLQLMFIRKISAWKQNHTCQVPYWSRVCLQFD